MLSSCIGSGRQRICVAAAAEVVHKQAPGENACAISWREMLSHLHAATRACAKRRRRIRRCCARAAAAARSAYKARMFHHVVGAMMRDRDAIAMGLRRMILFARRHAAQRRLPPPAATPTLFCLPAILRVCRLPAFPSPFLFPSTLARVAPPRGARRCLIEISRAAPPPRHTPSDT